MPLEFDLAERFLFRIKSVDAVDRSQQSRFSASGRTNDRCDFVRVEAQRKIEKNLLLSVKERKVFYLHNRLAGFERGQGAKMSGGYSGPVDSRYIRVGLQCFHFYSLIRLFVG
jgi:hypothetical protein